MTAPANSEGVDGILARLRTAPDNQSAWVELVRITWPFVSALCHRYLISPRGMIDVEDVAQEVYLKLARYMASKNPVIHQDTLFSLLAVIARHTTIDANRWLARARRDVSKERFQSTFEGAADPSLAKVDLDDVLQRVSLSLAQTERTLLTLRLQGYESLEIAERLGMSRRTVERKLKRIFEEVMPHFQP